MSVMHGYFMEPSRRARMVNRQDLKQMLPKYNMPQGRFQAEIPGAWLRDPIEPERRRIFHVALREALYAGELDYTAKVMMIVVKSSRLVLHSNPSDPKEAEEGKRRIAERDALRSQESREKEAAELKQWKEIIDGSDVPGLGEGDETSQGIKFFAFIQSDVDEEILTSFLESVPELDRRQASYRYEFPQVKARTGPTSTVREKAKAILEQRSPYTGMSEVEVYQAWLDLIEPFSETRSMYGMHAYVVLDEQTVEDGGDTVLLATETDGEFRSRRIDLEALKEGLVIKCVEALKLDVDQIPGDWTGVIRGPVMQIAQTLWDEDQEERGLQRLKEEENQTSTDQGEEQTE